MSCVSMALVGLGGFGKQYIRWFQEGEIPEADGKLVAVVDPYAAQSESYQWTQEQNIPVFNTLEELYQKHKIDLILISSPTELHKPQIMTAVENGSHVLCEKPLTATVSDAMEIKEYAEKHHRSVAVGFQWSFCSPIVQLKEDILANKFGKPVMLKSFLSWPRERSYYTESTWKGRELSKGGEPILDSVVANATAHYLHNIFFVLGKDIGTALEPTTLFAELYRANDIESFDTAILRGTFADGGELYYSASHATDVEQREPIFEYRFEKGTVYFNKKEENSIIYAEFADGTTKEYGNPFPLKEVSQKVRDMIAHIQNGKTINCTVETILPHLLVSNALFSLATIHEFPKEIVTIGEKYTSVKNLDHDLFECYQQEKFPSENNIAWSYPPDEIPLKSYGGYVVEREK